MHTQRSRVQICTVYMFYWVHFDAGGYVLVKKDPVRSGPGGSKGKSCASKGATMFEQSL